MTGPREEQAWRGGGAMGTAESRELALRWKASWARAAVPVATGPSPSVGQDPTLPWTPPSGNSGPTAPCKGTSPTPSSTSRVGDAGGEIRGLRLVEAPESSFSRPFFSFWKTKQNKTWILVGARQLWRSYTLQGTLIHFLSASWLFITFWVDFV